MSTLSGQKIVVVGGSSGIGFSVAKLSLFALAAEVLVVSSSAERVKNAVARLQGIAQENNLPGKVFGDTVDGSDTAKVNAFFKALGAIDHLVWTSGDSLPGMMGFPDSIDLEKVKGAFNVRFWGAVAAAQAVAIKPGGSITLTTGLALLKPPKSWSIPVGITGAVDSIARGLAVDLAPIRVNSVCPGAIETELFDAFPAEGRAKMMAMFAEKTLVKKVGLPDECAEAYVFCMKCNYITGQRIEVDGGAKYV